MTERTDHAGAARTILGNVSPVEMKSPDTPNWLAVAQAHATLALVEQQRIANLLILLKPENPRNYDVWPEIASALGIAEVQS